MQQIRRSFQVFKACGYIGNDRDCKPTTQEEVLLPTGMTFKSTQQDDKDDEDDELRRLQEMADANGILLPTQFNRKISKI